MNTIKANGIRWFFTPAEGLAHVLEGLREDETIRRSYTVRECAQGRVFIKYFFEKGFIAGLRNRVFPRGRKEYEISRAILSFSIATPRPLAYGIGEKGSFVVHEFLDARNYKAAFDEGRERQELLDRLAHLIRQLTDRRIVHNDLHLENVIVADGVPHLIDLHKARIAKAAFSRRDELTNLTHALTMVYGDMTEGQKQRFFQEYGNAGIRPLVESGLVDLWMKWVRSKKKRAFSSTSKLMKSQGGVCVRGEEHRTGGAMQKTIKTDTKVVVARHSDHIRKIYTNGRRLKKAWKNHVVLEYLGLPAVPRGFCCRWARGGERGYVAMEDLGGRGEELDRFLDRRYDSLNMAERRRFVDALARFLSDVMKKGVLHRDMKACNIFALDDGGFRFLDVEDVVFGAVGEEDIVRMAVQLNSSLPVRFRTSDRMRFIVRLTENLPCDRKRVFRTVVRESLSREVVYEGADGLRRESWGRPSPGPRSPFSRPPQ